MKNRYLLYIILSMYLLGSFIGNVFHPHITISGDSEIGSNPYTVNYGESFEVAINLDPEWFVKAWEFKIAFDPNYLMVNSIRDGGFFQNYLILFNPGNISNENGTVTNIYGLILGEGNVSDPGVLAIISFTAKNIEGTTEIIVYDYGITNESMYLPLNATNGSILVTISSGEVWNTVDGIHGSIFNYSSENEIDSVGGSFYNYTEKSFFSLPKISQENNNENEDTGGIGLMEILVPICFFLLILAIIIRMFFW